MYIIYAFARGHMRGHMRSIQKSPTCQEPHPPLPATALCRAWLQAGTVLNPPEMKLPPVSTRLGSGKRRSNEIAQRRCAMADHNHEAAGWCVLFGSVMVRVIRISKLPRPGS